MSEVTNSINKLVFVSMNSSIVNLDPVWTTVDKAVGRGGSHSDGMFALVLQQCILFNQPHLITPHIFLHAQRLAVIFLGQQSGRNLRYSLLGRTDQSCAAVCDGVRPCVMRPV